MLGVLSVLQISVLPGMLIWRFYRADKAGMATIGIVLGLSLVANYLLVFLLASLGLYRSAVVYMVFAAEAAALTVVFRRELRSPVGGVLRILGERTWGSYLRARSGMTEAAAAGPLQLGLWLLRLALAVAGASVLFCYAFLFVDDLGKIFDRWDVVVSWNRWAVDWSANRLPSYTWHYPQLLPANWSVSYRMIGSSGVQFFARAVMPLFPLVVLVHLLHLGKATKRSGCWVGVIATGLLFWRLLGPYALRSALADVPAAFFACSSICCLLLSRVAPRQVDAIRLLVTGFALTGGAAVTKQAGLYILLVYPLLGYLVAARDKAVMVNGGRVVLAGMAVSFLGVGPWYVCKHFDILAGNDVSEVLALTSHIHGGAGLWERLVSAFRWVSYYLFGMSELRYAGVVAGGLVLLVSLRDRAYRWITMLVIIPYGLIWALFF